MRIKSGKAGRGRFGEQMKLYLIRHGETDWNKERKLQGKSDIELNTFGRTLARKTAKHLRDLSFDLAITSPLKRAKETAKILLEGREIPLLEDERLAEMGFGCLEGYYCKGEKMNIPDPKFHYFYDDPACYQAPEGGESFEELLKRAKGFLADLCEKKAYENKTILLSTHGAMLRALLDTVKGIGVEQFWDSGVQKNCAVSVIEIKDGIAKVIEEGVIYYDDEVEDW